MIAALLARSIFALAAGAALAASAGVAVPAHQEEPGTPPEHDHALGAYRFAFLVPAAESVVDPAMERLHRTLLDAGVPPDVVAQMPGMAGIAESGSLPVVKRGTLSPVQDLAVVLALLIVAVPRLPRPTRRPVADLPRPRLGRALWELVPALAPPRAPFILTAAPWAFGARPRAPVAHYR